MPTRFLTLAALCVLSAACASGMSSQALRGEAADAPERFMVLDAASGERRDAGPGPDCANPLVDPRDGTRLTLERSSGGQGDYLPAAARYGLAGDELLRIDCHTGATLGRVSR